jgi:hypothetical protein
MSFTIPKKEPMTPKSIRFKDETLAQLSELGAPAEVARVIIETALSNWSEFEKLGTDTVD